MAKKEKVSNPFAAPPDWDTAYPVDMSQVTELRDRGEMKAFKVGVKVFWFAIACSFVLYIARILYLQGVYGDDDFYAVWGATDVIITYMNQHNGEWPRSWEDLRELYDTGGGGVGGWTFEMYQNRVIIDFAADTMELQELSLRPGPVKFNVVHARLTYWINANDPNEGIRRYFQWKKEAQSAQPSVETTD